MTSMKTENKHWENPEDFGLPYVDITPLPSAGSDGELESVSSQKEEIIVSPMIVQTEGQDQTDVHINASQEVSEVSVDGEQGFVVDNEEIVVSEAEGLTEAIKIRASAQIIDSDGEVAEDSGEQMLDTVATEVLSPPLVGSDSGKNKIKSNSDVPKKSKAWVWIVALITLILFGVIYDQIQREVIADDSKLGEQTPAESKSDQAGFVAKENEDLLEVPKVEVEQVDSDLASAKQELEKQIGVDSNQKIVKKDGVERVATKLDKPRYFIVVGSLTSESMAIKEAAKYADRAAVVYLILPYGNVPNHRLSIGYFDSLNQATNELERIKNEYTESLWILKY